MRKHWSQAAWTRQSETKGEVGRSTLLGLGNHNTQHRYITKLLGSWCSVTPMAKSLTHLITQACVKLKNQQILQSDPLCWLLGPRDGKADCPLHIHNTSDLHRVFTLLIFFSFGRWWWDLPATLSRANRSFDLFFSWRKGAETSSFSHL